MRFNIASGFLNDILNVSHKEELPTNDDDDDNNKNNNNNNTFNTETNDINTMNRDNRTAATPYSLGT